MVSSTAPICLDTSSMETRMKIAGLASIPFIIVYAVCMSVMKSKKMLTGEAAQDSCQVAMYGIGYTVLFFVLCVVGLGLYRWEYKPVSVQAGGVQVL